LLNLPAALLEDNVFSRLPGADLARVASLSEGFRDLLAGPDFWKRQYALRHERSVASGTGALSWTLKPGAPKLLFRDECLFVEQRRPRRLNAAGVRSVQFTPDGLLLCTAGTDGVQLWQVADGELVRSLAPGPSRFALLNHDASVALVEISRLRGDPAWWFEPLREVEASNIEQQGLQLVRVSDCHVLHWFPTQNSYEEFARASFSPDGTLVAVASEADTNVVKVWEVIDGTEHTLDHPEWVTNVSFSPDGALIATTSSDCVVRLWATGTFDHVTQIDDEDQGEYPVFSPDSTKLLVSGWASNAVLFDISDEHQLLHAVLDFNAKPVADEEGNDDEGRTRASFSPDGAFCLTHCFLVEQPLQVWNTASGELVASLGGSDTFATDVRSALFSPDGERVLAHCADGSAFLWRVRDGLLLRRFDTGSGCVSEVGTAAFSPDGALVALASSDSGVVLAASCM